VCFFRVGGEGAEKCLVGLKLLPFLMSRPPLEKRKGKSKRQLTCNEGSSTEKIELTVESSAHDYEKNKLLVVSLYKQLSTSL